MADGACLAKLEVNALKPDLAYALIDCSQCRHTEISA